MIAGYVVKTTCHLFLALYMWNSNRLSDRDAVSSGESLPEEERARLAESEGMIRWISSLLSCGLIFPPEGCYGVR
ncbi:hypothetical protein DFH06DRAFT_1221772 [Mycena polygramma]|nr:hypothetical protein DFH06DRAFT_1247125 [Mycena polygramma]KAJ7633840.1 hypothetical protein DFH06DRAFT_1221772 [Mycena polygramma]